MISIEADPYNFSKLKRNISLNQFDNCIAVNLGVSNKEETLKLALNLRGNRGNQSFLNANPLAEFVEVRCNTLYNILRDTGINRITGLKIDIEGFEYRVLKQFFAEAPLSLHPSFLIIEFFPNRTIIEGGNSLDLLMQNGYSVYSSSGCNYVLSKYQN